MLALNLVQPITHGIQKVRIGRHDCAIEVKLDDRLRFVERIKLCCKLLGRLEQLHFPCPLGQIDAVRLRLTG